MMEMYIVTKNKLLITFCLIVLSITVISVFCISNNGSYSQTSCNVKGRVIDTGYSSVIYETPNGYKKEIRHYITVVDLENEEEVCLFTKKYQSDYFDIAVGDCVDVIYTREDITGFWVIISLKQHQNN